MQESKPRVLRHRWVDTSTLLTDTYQRAPTRGYGPCPGDFDRHNTAPEGLIPHIHGPSIVPQQIITYVTGVLVVPPVIKGPYSRKIPGPYTFGKLRSAAAKGVG